MNGKWKIRRLKCSVDGTVHETILFFEAPSGRRRLGDWAPEGVYRAHGWFWAQREKGSGRNNIPRIAEVMGFEPSVPNTGGRSAAGVMRDYLSSLGSELEVRTYLEYMAKRLNAEGVDYEW